MAEELSKADQMFKDLDQDGDGSVPAEELRIYLQTHGVTDLANTVSEMMREQDTDGNGSLDIAEVRAFYARREPIIRPPGMSPSETFWNSDLDGSGFIEAEEVRRAMSHMPGTMGVILRRYDNDCNCKIDLEEWEQVEQGLPKSTVATSLDCQRRIAEGYRCEI